MRNGFESMRKRMEYLGTSKDDKWGSDGRIVKGKLLSFYDALNNSYQAEWIILNDTEDKTNKERYRCLINPDKLKDDYDKKIISADFCLGLKEGDVFYWERTKTHWMVTLQHIEEEAYFRANIQRCDYQFEINNNKYWVYLRGPVETTIQWRQKHQLEFNDLNYSLLMYIVKNEETVNFLKRHQVVTFDNHRWKVVATDIYSNSGYMQVYLDEYFDNDLEPTQNTIDLEESKNVIDKADPYIEGPTEVNVYDRKVSFLIKNAEAGEFVVNSNKVKIDKMDSSLCRLNILAEKGNFDIFYQIKGNVVATLTVKINSL